MIGPGLLIPQPSMFGAHGREARLIAPLGWGLTALSAFVVVAVCAFIIVAVWRTRRSHPGHDVEPEPARLDRRMIVIAGALIPAVITVAAFWWTSSVQNALAAAPPRHSAARIRVIGHRWWWEVQYAGDSTPRAVTANEVHLPVGQAVQLTLIGGDVIHSFWVPQLAGKTDLIPGQENTMWVEAESPGTYRGECAEYCGLQHSNMNLVVVAEPPESFEAWLAREAGAAATPNDSTSRVGEVVYRRECSRCHAIRGTDMLRDSAPDLTHIASRLTLGADLMNNVPGALAGWIENAPALKPGVLMPPRPLAGPELHALVTYLEGLR